MQMIEALKSVKSNDCDEAQGGKQINEVGKDERHDLLHEKISKLKKEQDVLHQKVLDQEL